jgi:hypothetical protein
VGCQHLHALITGFTQAYMSEHMQHTLSQVAAEAEDLPLQQAWHLLVCNTL